MVHKVTLHCLKWMVSTSCGLGNKFYFNLNAGCLLRSLPTDVILDNVTGFSFTCDLSDNIAAPWPSSSSISSISLCAPGNCTTGLLFYIFSVLSYIANFHFGNSTLQRCRCLRYQHRRILKTLVCTLPCNFT